MNIDITSIKLKDLLANREVFQIFDEEFSGAIWLDVTALLKSESTLNDLYKDNTVPKEVLDRIVKRLTINEMSGSENVGTGN
jgi:hypothetical protein